MNTMADVAHMVRAELTCDKDADNTAKNLNHQFCSLKNLQSRKFSLYRDGFKITDCQIMRVARTVLQNCSRAMIIYVEIALELKPNDPVSQNGKVDIG